MRAKLNLVPKIVKEQAESVRRGRPILCHVHGKNLHRELLKARRYCTLDNAFKRIQYLARHYAEPGTVIELVHEHTGKQLGWIKARTKGKYEMWDIREEQYNV